MNKVLVKLYVPMLDESYDVFIPVNEIVWRIKKLLIKSVSDLSDINLDINKNYILINIETGTIYDDNNIIISTDIRNSTSLALIDI
ncbi:MAG: hypothetical protein SPJ07_04495 [Bacilli bacterium]|nr:hypothetical protein [Bacilli bacterium]